jgi:hypothetical protein
MSTSYDSETQFSGVVGNEKPRIREPTSTSSRSPVDRTCIWGDVQPDSLRTPFMTVMRVANSQVLQQLRDSVTRVRTLAQSMKDSVHQEGSRGISDELHVIDTPVPRVSEHITSIGKYFNRKCRAVMALSLFMIQWNWQTGVASLYETD